ncbi:MAG: AAA family ATPase [Candidatus Heimdallarchaeum aukensis]|uniref:AAA family ATPase n=1 Tax=Candidatus Heimdallarchaeum aukensis TaxID=2876573 RepID=A0A9Y1BLW4_9ARCH|nr:MAG: AAA family ATPase [Candidatus Heimdallarchaeum aukensis]
MKILWIHMENFKCYRNERIPETGILPKGLIFVEGENSVGKTSLFDAIYYALFYEPTKDKAILGTKDMLVKRGEKETIVEVAFEIMNKYFVVQKQHGISTPLKVVLLQIDREMAEKGELKNPIKIAEGLEDVNKKLFELLNITSESVLSTLIVNQGEVQKLAEAKGAELRDIIYKLFHLDDIREKLKRVINRKMEILDEEWEKYKIERTTENILEEIKEIEIEKETKEKELVKAKNELEKIEEKISQYPKHEDIQSISNILTQIQQTKETISKQERIIKQKSETLEIKELTQEEIKDKILEIEKIIQKTNNNIENLRNKRDKVQKKLHSLQRDLAEIKEKIKKLESHEVGHEEDFTCELCEQTMPYSKFKELVESKKQSITNIELGIKKRTAEKREVEKQIEKESNYINKLKEQIFSLNNVKDRLDNLENNKKELDKKQNNLITQLKKFKVQTVDQLSKKYNVENFEEFFSIISQLKSDKASLNASISHLNKTIEKLKQRKNQLEKEIDKNKEKEEKQESILQEQAALKDVEGVVSSFIAEELISNRLLAGIQQTTNPNINLFTRGKYSEIYLEATTKKTLRLSVLDKEEEFVKNQEFLSGGDKAAIGLGLRLGISELLKQIRPFKDSPHNPPRMDIMILDEPLGSLDSERRKKVLEGLLIQKKFSQIFLITHTNVREELRAPSIRVSRTEKGSSTAYYPAPSKIELESEE